MERTRRLLTALCAILIAQFALGALSASAAEPSRVSAARERHEAEVREWYAQADVDYPPKTMLIRVFKASDEVEVWAQDRSGRMRQVRSYPVCARSGELGPKRRQGDLQVPEGIYRVDRLNAWSSYHLSLGVDYPNQSDRIRGRARHSGSLGGDIFVHGDCVTIGCVPIEDGPIETLFLPAWDARMRYGKKARVDVHIFPDRLDEERLRALIDRSPHLVEHHGLWRELQPYYLKVQRAGRLPRRQIRADGSYAPPRD